MRILVLSDVPPYVIGGAETQAWRLAVAWSKLGHRVEIVGHRIKTETLEGIQLYRLPVLKSWGRAIRGLSYFLSLTRFLLKYQKCYDLVYCRFIGEAALSVALLKEWRLVHIPLVSVPASGGEKGNSDVALLYSLPFTSKLVALLNRQCDCINYISPGVEDSLHKVGLRPKCSAYIPNGVNVPDFDAHKLKIQPKKEQIVFVGRLTHQKGLDILLKALFRLYQANIYFKCILIGDGPLRPELEKQVALLRITKQILFLGIRSQSEIREILSYAWVFVLPSRYEGLSNAALEALAHGVPCILSRCGGVDTYLTPETGWVFDIEDDKGLEQALVDALLISEEKRQKMFISCRRLVSENFSLEEVSKRYLELFENLLANK